MLTSFAAFAQDQSPSNSQTPSEPERWNLFYQATSIGQYHGTFNSPYSGPFSLQDYPERDVSLTTTLFSGFRLEKNTALYFDPKLRAAAVLAGWVAWQTPPMASCHASLRLRPSPTWLDCISPTTSDSAARKRTSKAMKISWPASVL